ncbi:phospholipid transport system substrate-binding protein [Methylomarinovum tepidoasis]|uniref:Phospholipid transport system substrate-binding protein n=1 Tax=Methylomarinovum tepidoasis TaxID=2840183 RepID=A0AAU9C4C6_9GAMM|nr:ABC transporter substrate-binding protein [Methylomarinovum sp. IN45]BCX88332.1 phospholipid transport system substrate-binding protein [Methylomarinovum sp. IN45]
MQKLTITKTWLAWLLALAGLMIMAEPIQAEDDLLPPQQLIKEVSDQIQRELRRIDYKVDFKKAVEIVDKYIEPHVDFDRFAALVLGKYWRTATPEQRARFKQEFKTMLIRTYATAYGEYADWEIRFKPIRDWNPKKKKVVVQTEFVQPGKQPAQVAFRMIRKGDEWKAYDVIIEGVDLVKNYRTTFTEEIAQTGSLDALIERLAQRNREALEKGPEASALVKPVAGA